MKPAIYHLQQPKHPHRKIPIYRFLHKEHVAIDIHHTDRLAQTF